MPREIVQPDTGHVCPMPSAFFRSGYFAAETGIPPVAKFKVEHHNDLYLWGYFTYVAIREELIAPDSAATVL